MSFLPRRLARLLVLLILPATLAGAQDLYDPTVLRTIALQFQDADWMQRLRNNYVSETYILADLTIDGQVYPDVGVRIRGNTSYTALPAGSEKFSLKIKVDHVHADQDVQGYDNLNLNNGFRDPTFTREVVYNNFVARFVPNPRANHVLVTLNGQNWGVYNNIQQPDKRMLRDFFANADGLRIKCANRPNGPGLAYAGTSPSNYVAYEIQNDGGLADPLASLIAVTNALSNTPLANWQDIDALFAIDPSIWSVVLENLLTDDDSYINKGCDFMTYTDPLDGRLHLMQRDANETFTQTNWAINRNFTQTNKPLLSRVLAVPELRQRYMAHYRTARQDLDWAYFEPIFAAHRALIEAHVQADPKKIYTYPLFQNNFASTVNLGLSGLAGGTLVGIQQFVNQRATFLNGNGELVAVGPAVSEVAATSDTPQPGEPVWATARVQPAGSPVAQVRLYWRPSPSARFGWVEMRDDGQSGDGSAGDGVYGAQFPVAGSAGQRVAWYVSATAGNAFASMRFAPALAERGPLSLEFALGGIDGMRITEWMYAGANGEFIEFTNLSAAPIDMAGWSMDDSNAVPGAFDLSAFGVVQPGESVIVTEADAEGFRLAWALAPQVKIIGQLGVATGNNLGRNDQIHLYDAAAALHDRLFYGDQTYPGTIRTQNRSGQSDCAFIGANQVAGWQLSALGDGFGSFASTGADLGTPGQFDAASCGGDAIFADGFE